MLSAVTKFLEQLLEIIGHLFLEFGREPHVVLTNLSGGIPQLYSRTKLLCNSHSVCHCFGSGRRRTRLIATRICDVVHQFFKPPAELGLVFSDLPAQVTAGPAFGLPLLQIVGNGVVAGAIPQFELAALELGNFAGKTLVTSPTCQFIEQLFKRVDHRRLSSRRRGKIVAKLTGLAFWIFNKSSCGSEIVTNL